jgi:hypothetical protein
MLKNIRQKYNAAFTDAAYQSFLNYVNTATSEPCTFRISETPIFIPKKLKEKLLQGVAEITDELVKSDFRARSEAAIPPDLKVPNEDAHPVFLQLDFGICEGADGELTPQLIEMQGFPSLYFFQNLLAAGFRENFDIPENMHHLFGDFDEKGYVNLLREVIIGNSKPERVILLEIEPEKQNTRIDFGATANDLGLKVLCLSKLRRDGRKLFYENESGERIPVERIYNRIIFDELEKKADLPREWSMFEEVDAVWVGHPNWFFRISKYTLPFIKSQFVPETIFLHQLKSVPTDLENWVLKPLFSFSGMGVKFNVVAGDIEAVADPENWILQKKVKYAAAVESPNEPVKAEVRMMMVWLPGHARPTLVNNLVRMSKGEMVGVRYNKDKDWVGASVAFFER